MSHEWQRERHELHQRLKAARDAIDEVLQTVNWDTFDLCECGHRRADHKRVLSAESIYDACAVDGCPCVDFDDSLLQYRHDAEVRERREARQALRAVDEGRAA